MYSAEDIDKLGIISGITYREDQPVRAQHSGYLSLVSRINYRIFPKLNLFAKGMYETLKSEKATGSYYPENTEPPGDIRVVSNIIR